MFDIGWSELFVIAVVAIIVIGPKELPRLMRTFGHYVGKLRRAAADFQRQFEEAARDTELEDMRQALQELRGHPSHFSNYQHSPLMTRKPGGSAKAVAGPVSPAPAKPPKGRKPRKTSAPAKSKPVSKKRAPRPRRAARRKEDAR
jgi:sec-independent protein translocase protein TatB